MLLNVENYEKVYWLDLPAGWKDWTYMQKAVHVLHVQGQQKKDAAVVLTPAPKDTTKIK